MKFYSFFLALIFIISCAPTKNLPKTVYQEIVDFQDTINKEFKDPKESPLTKEDLAQFKSLHFFPIKSKFRVVAEFKRTPNEATFEMKTSTDRLPKYVKYGEAKFRIDNEWFTLDIFQNIKLTEKEKYKDYLFFPFQDLSNGDTSYGGGRYIDLRIPKGKTIVIDFNQAYNPYCAYSGRYSCPIPPAQNFINKNITAGVRKFHD